MAQFVLTPDPFAQAPVISPDDILAGLNDAQQEAAALTDGPVLIIAGPGSGKTRTLTHRIAYLLATGRAKPWQILAITFTNKAAREMRLRVAELLGDEITKGMWIGTFHSMFARVLRRECTHIGFTSDFTIYDSDDSQRIVKELMQSHNINTSDVRPRSIYSLISGARNRMVSPSEFATLATSPMHEFASRVFQPYIDRLRRANAMDFDDLLLKPLELFTGHKDVLARYQDRWKYIHVDEYQDTNRAQYLLAKTLAAQNQNLCVVGDDAQSIYAFRGADIGNILSFQKDYPEAPSVRLEQNYRSTKNIVKLADSIIQNNKSQLEKSLWTENPVGDPVIVVEAISERDEAQKIERKVRDIQIRLGLLYRDFAVLYRTNAQSRSIEDALRKGGIPYRVIGGMSFYQRKEIKDALAYLRLVVNQNDIASLRRVINLPTRGIGDRSQTLLFAFADREGIGVWDALDRVDESGIPARAANSVKKFRDMIAGYRTQMVSEPEMTGAADLAKAIIRDSTLLEDLRKENTPENLVRWENVQELLNAISEFSSSTDEMPSLSEFLQEITLFTDADAPEESDNHVTLMTLHASKGLEFPVVFLAGMEEGLFPLAGATQDAADLEEERRLFYVGATRAERILMLLFARSRWRYGEQQAAIRSRFLEEIDPSVVRTEAGQAYEVKSGRFSMNSRSGVKYEDMDPHYYRESLQQGKSGRSSTNNAGRNTARKTARESPSPAQNDSSPGRTIVYDEDESIEIVPGMMVEHAQFGEGKVISKDGKGDQAKVVVFFRSVGQKKLILRFARLRRVE